jgi:ubiquinone biosynthesis protein COQ4
MQSTASPLAPVDVGNVKRPRFPLLRSLIKIMRDPNETSHGARLVMTFDRRQMERNYQDFAAHPQGRLILEGAPSLFELLTDRDALASLPDGSLGRVYLEFMRREGISTEALDAEVEPVEREVIGPDPMRRRFNQHMRASHDLWHVLTGYHRDLLGELQVLMFSYRQTGSPAFKWITRLARLRAERQMPGAHALLDLASDRGERATCLATVDWARHLARPIDEVRTTLNIGPPPSYTRYMKSPSGRGLIPETPTP